MKLKYAMLAFFVSWQLNFNYGEKTEMLFREREFDTKVQALEFMSHRPPDCEIFDCYDSMTGRIGKCAIHDMILTERD